MDRVATATQQLGPGALLAKLDIRSAYRLIPVHPDDRPLFGFSWRGHDYVDGMLPFGLHSAPKIFTAVVDALEWILRCRGVTTVDHYLDDFVTLGPPASPLCGAHLDTILHTCSELGLPLAMDKLDGPTSCIVFLGIEIDMRAGILRLPDDKLQRILQTLSRWANRRACVRRELESLIGLLHHACKVVRPGRSFLRRMIDLLRVPQRPHHHVRLNQPFWADLQWWASFTAQWNGVAILPSPHPPVHEVTSDASGSWGCSAWSNNSWFQYQWTETAADIHISFRELFAVLLACATWGGGWRGARVRCRCNNMAAVQCVARRTCRDPPLMHLLRCLFFVEAFFQFELVAVHLPGCSNELADDLSRDRLSSFLLKAPHMDPHPTELHPHLLLNTRSSWSSAAWTRLFTTTLNSA